jgi:hypothetical protein
MAGRLIFVVLLLMRMNGAKQIGVGGKQRAAPSRLIVDGQQRVTSLKPRLTFFAIFRTFDHPVC